MKKKTYQDDKTWKEIAPHLTGQCRQHGGMAKDNRKQLYGSCLLYNQGDLRFFLEGTTA